MSILIIGNKGSFSSKISDLISRKYKIEFFQIEKEIEIDKSISQISRKLILGNFKNLIYLGGETRFNNLMKRFNEDFLKKIFLLSKEYNLNLIYLSSLAVFGIPREESINCYSKRKPFNLYGKTKNSADIFIKENLGKTFVFSLMPASIISESEHNFYVKLKKIMTNNIVKKIFYILCPGGQFSFCSYINIADEIINIIESINNSNIKNYLSKNKFQEIIVSYGKSIREIYYEANNYYPIFDIPSININFVKIIFFFLNPRLLLRMIFLFSVIDYKNKY